MRKILGILCVMGMILSAGVALGSEGADSEKIDSYCIGSTCVPVQPSEGADSE